MLLLLVGPDPGSLQRPRRSGPSPRLQGGSGGERDSHGAACQDRERDSSGQGHRRAQQSQSGELERHPGGGIIQAEIYRTGKNSPQVSVRGKGDKGRFQGNRDQPELV